MSLLVNMGRYLQSLFLVVALLLVFVVYTPGLQGGFLFDDDPNLLELGSYGGVVDYETFNNFVFNGVSSSIGRPIALASFLLDDNTWPSTAKGFKETNVKIHLLVGLLLCWASLNLMRLLGRSETEAIWIALLNCAIWLMHPYMLSTTLYVVQRMAQLAALFILCGITAYLHGRFLISAGRIKSGYIWMSCSLVTCTVLGVLSKENGALLVLLVLVLESILPSNAPKLFWRWRLFFLWLPSSIIIIYLCGKLNADAWVNRPFTQWERVLTQPRILFEYLYHLYIPRIEGRGLFQDGYVFSRNLLSPITTLTSISALFFLVLVAFLYRKRFPVLCLSILFFFASHLLESTWLNLELYFEHRNYAASLFLFLPLAVGLVQLHKIIDFRLAGICVISVFCVLFFLTWQRSNLWSNTGRLQYYWALATPESVRAQNQIANTFLNLNEPDKAVAHLTAALKQFENSGFLAMNLLYIKIQLNSADEKDFIFAGELLTTNPFDPQSITCMRLLIDKLAEVNSNPRYVKYGIVLLDKIHSSAAYSKILMFEKLYFYCKGRLYLRLSEYDSAMKYYQLAMAAYSETDAALSMVAEMGYAGQPKEALILLDQAKNIYAGQSDLSLKRSRKLYDKEFARMKSTLEELAVHELNPPSYQKAKGIK